MEGASEGVAPRNRKCRNTICTDVACQTEQSTNIVYQQAMSSIQQQQGPAQQPRPAQQQQPAAQAAAAAPSSPSGAAGGSASSIAVDAPSSAGSSDAGPAGSTATPAASAAPTSPAPSSNNAAPAASSANKPQQAITNGGPAGVRPNDIENYFGDNTASKEKAPHPGAALAAAQQKARAPQTGNVEINKKNTSNAATSSNGNNVKAADGPSWNDENCKLRLVIPRFSALEETMCSSPKSIEGVSWKIMVMPKQHMVQKKQQKCMGFFLQCAPEKAYSDAWSVHAIADMRMISYKPNVPHFARRTTHTYTSKENDWGYSCFMTWADIIDEAQGYIRDDTVVLEIAVKAEAPRNMMSHEDFLDKIEKWIILADMQMKKGNIDLALEANQSALKFCKGKDDECYTRLETQRETFVNAKLFESIERIEKGPVVCQDTTHGKPTSLRQALTGAQKSLNGKMTAKGGKKTRAVVTVQHMKKKKPYDQKDNQQRTNTGPTVKDLVEKRKNGKEDAKKDALRSKEEADADEQTESDESIDEKAAGSEEEEDAEFDDEEYNEGDYGSQEADEVSTIDIFGSGQDDVDLDIDVDLDDANTWDNDSSARLDAGRADQVIEALKLYRSNDEQEKAIYFQGQYDDEVLVCDRQVQTDFEDICRRHDYDDERQHQLEVERMMAQERLLAETVLRKFQDQDVAQETVYTDSYYTRTGLNVRPNDQVETIFGGNASEGDDSFSEQVLESLPAQAAQAPAPVMAPGISANMRPDSEPQEEACQLYNAEKMIKRWLDLEGALSGNVDPEGVLASLSEEDRRDLLDELNFKLNPLIVALDHEFRETVSVANNVLDSARMSLFSSQRMVVDCDKAKELFDDKLQHNFSDPIRDMQKKAEAGNAKKATSAPATSTSGTKTGANGRPTVIAKRSMKQVVLEADQTEDTVRGRVTDFLRNVETATSSGGSDDAVYRMRDALEGFKDLHRKMLPMMTTINANNDRVTRIFTKLCDDNGPVAEKIHKILTDSLLAYTTLSEDLKKAKEALHAAMEEKKVKEKLFSDNSAKFQEEAEKHAKALKEIKELKNQLKKAESKATKEENRATTLQAQLNEIEEKAKVVRKELDTLKKKTTDERAKTKKEKDRDTQTIRQQSIEINERESERDKARKELEEANRQKEKFEKDKKAVAGQLTSMTDRARAAEVAVMEFKWNLASEEMKKRREAVQNGFTETETLANRVRQVSDRDMMRKSLAEWKAALDKIDAQTKTVKGEYDHATELIKNGVKTLSQTLDIKLPAVDALPNLVKPPPVQVVAPSPSVIPPPIMPPTPAAGVIGQQRTPIGGGRQGPSTTAAVETAAPGATPSRARVQQRVPSPVALKNPTRTDDAPSSLWSWNTIGNLGDLRPSSRSEQQFNTMDSLQRDIWAANGNNNGSLGSDFLRTSSTHVANPMATNIGAPGSNNFLRSQSQTQQPTQSVQMNQNYQQQSQMQQQQAHHHQNQRMQQQQQTRGYGDMWNAQAMQGNPGQQDYQSQAARMMAHNGAGDLSNGGGYGSPWQNPPSQQQQLRGPTPQQQQQQGGHHNMFQSHSFFDSGM
ncbi:CBN-PQN-87 protein [Caenorhabditis brenneri]|uniref:CBN-PQN-87 protein n=1 Tax=Caenorhabditis brenneri TaxID=135651 RepID=G0MUQ3_CAEBE|nr:CBN-PQN-87 protein [Caenorhabditis brenneri]